MDRVVVIGGSGFVGSHTADELSDRGYAVTIFDVVESPWLRADQDMVIGDTLDREALGQALRGARYVYHFAGVANIAEATDRPFEAIKSNIMGTTTALEAAVDVKAERFLHASTMYVYTSEGSFYSASKKAAETLIEAYHDKYGIEFTMLRYGSLYGPRAQDWNGLKRLVRQIVSEGKLEYPGSGRERREYIHVEDAARLSVEVLDSKFANRAVILTGTQVLSSLDLVDMIFEIAGVSKQVDFAEKARSSDHYTLTTYRYSPKRATKLVPSEFIDIGQGILDLVTEIQSGNEEC